MKQVSVVIPTFNAVGLLQKNIPRILKAVRTGDEVVIIDDAGTDETKKWLCKEYQLEEKFFELENLPKDYYPNLQKTGYDLFSNQVTISKKIITITLVQLHANLRFAGAANSGVALAKNELIFMCNNDVIPESDCFEKLVPHFDDEAVFAVGCLEYESDAKGQKSGKNILYFERGIFQHNRAPQFTAGPTAWASGGSAMFDAAKWKELAGFDKAYYPAYWEDIDLSFRARKNGWKVLFEPNAVVYHKHESTHASVFGQQKMAQMSWKNAFTFTKKNANVWQLLQFWFWYPYWYFKSQRVVS